MLPVRREQRKSIQNNRLFSVLRSRAGDAVLILGMAGFILVVSFSAMMFQRQQLYTVTGDVSADITAVLTSTASGQLYNSYASLRDGRSGSVMYDGFQYREIQNTDKFRTLFTSLYKDSHLQGDTIVKMQNGRMVFTLSNLRLFVSNASGGEVKSRYRVEYDLTVANAFLWSGTNTVLRDQVQTVEYMNKF